MTAALQVYNDFSLDDDCEIGFSYRVSPQLPPTQTHERKYKKRKGESQQKIDVGGREIFRPLPPTVASQVVVSSF